MSSSTALPRHLQDTSSRTPSPSREPLITDRRDPARLAKEASIRHKLRTYETFLALRAGYMPTTEQITAWARYILRESSILDSRNRKLSGAGRRFIRDVRAWIDAVAEAAEMKNGDDKIQDFLYHTGQAEISARFPDVGGAGQRIAAGPDAKELYKRLRLLGGLLYASPEFRKLISDVALVARDVFADAASTVSSYATSAAERVRPPGDAMAQLETSAETTIPPPEAGDAAAAKAEARAKATSPSQLRKQAAQKSRDYADETRRRVIRAGDDLQEYLKQKFPKQRRDAVINRLKHIVADVQKNPEFQETAEFVIQLVGDYVKRLKAEVLEEGKKSASEVGYDEHFEEAMQKGKEILTAFAGGKSPDDMKSALAQVVRDVQNDRELTEFYEDVTNYLSHMLREPSFAMSDAADAEAHEHYDRSRELLNRKTDAYRPHVETLFGELNNYMSAFQNDRINRRVLDASRKVFSDLVIRDTRRPSGYRLHSRVTRDLLDVTLPAAISELQYIPLPRIEYQDRDYDLILENVVLESEHFLPRRLVFEAHTRAEYVSEFVTTSHYSGYTRMHIANLPLSIKDASFVLRKKTGVFPPPFSDRGYFDLLMDGPGVSIDVVLDRASWDEYYDDTTDESDYADADTYFHVRSVKVDIHRFTYVYNAYHSWAAALWKPVVQPAIRRMVQGMLEDKIRLAVETLDREAHAMTERMRVATIATEGSGSLEAWIRAVLSRPESARRRQGTLERGERGVKYKTRGFGAGRGREREGEFAVTVGAEEELFPGEHGPGAVVSKFAKVEERVGRGGMVGVGPGRKEWSNEVFDVVVGRAGRY